MTALAGWRNFHVIVGSSAGALIGLPFVVLSLIADRPMVRSDAEAGGAFATPAIVCRSFPSARAPENRGPGRTGLTAQEPTRLPGDGRGGPAYRYLFKSGLSCFCTAGSFRFSRVTSSGGRLLTFCGVPPFNFSTAAFTAS